MLDLTKIASEIAWPISALLMFAIFILRLRSIGEALRRAPLIRKFKLGGFEVELDRNSLDEVKQQTDRTFLELINKTDNEVRKLAKAVDIFGALKAAAENIITNIPHTESSKNYNIRVTLHIPDIVFIDHLYQLSNYFYAENAGKFWQGASGAGRRFSIRYGIIGLAARTGQSQAVGDAFQGDADERKALIEHWSMLPDQVASAEKRPSCLAIVLRMPESSTIVGILYADGETKDLFGDKKQCLEFAEKCRSFVSVERLEKKLTDLRSLLSQFEINFDLTRIGQNHESILR